MRTVLGVGGSIAVARIYGIDVIGQYALAIAPALVLSLLSTTGEQAALVRQLSTLPPRAPRVTGLFVAVLAFSTGLTILVALIMSAVTWYLYEGPIDQPGVIAPALVYMWSYIVFDNPAWNLDIVFSSFRAGRELFQIRTAFALAIPVMSIVAGVIWGSVWALVGALMVASFLTLVHRVLIAPRFMTARVGRHEVAAGFRALPGLILFGLKLVPGRIADGASDQMGTWLLGAFGNASIVGGWNRASNLAKRLLETSNRVTEMLLPTIVERDAKGDAQGSDRSLVDSLRYAIVGMLFLAAPTSGAAASVMRLFGEGFDQAAPALAILMLLPALSTAQALLVVSLVARDRPGLATLTSLVRAGGTLLLSVPLAYFFGTTGAALGIVFGLGAALALLFPITARQLETPFRGLWPARQMAALLLAYATGFVAAHLVTSVVPGFPGLMPALCAGIIGFLAAFGACGGVDPRDRERAASIREMIRVRRTARAAGAA